MNKICSTCGVEKSTEEFHRDARKPDGRRNNCKECSVSSSTYHTRIASVSEKKCQFCKQVKPVRDFLRDNRRTLGYGIKCLDCAQMKLCRKCQSKKRLQDFPTSLRSADGYGYSCKQCLNEVVRKRYAEDPKSKQQANAKWYYSKESREGRRERMLMKKYGMTLWDYESLARMQDRKCRICGANEGDRGRSQLAVDHCHETGMIRGLLCDPCNRALGMFLESPEVLRAAIEYLQNSRAMHAHFG